MNRPVFALLIVLLVLAGGLFPAHAQERTADDFFHEAAQLYVDGALAPAEEAVMEGLRLDPAHSKLRALQQMLQRERPEGSGASDEGEEEDASDPPPGEAEQYEEEAGDEQQEPAPSDEEAPVSTEDDASDSRPEGGQPAEAEAERMDREQAERLLQALQLQELQLLRDVLKRDRPMQAIEKDW